MPFLMMLIVWWFAAAAGGAELSKPRRCDHCTPRPPQACFPKPKETPPCT